MNERYTIESMILSNRIKKHRIKLLFSPADYFEAQQEHQPVKRWIQTSADQVIFTDMKAFFTLSGYP